jgi:hypothetical protein
VSTVTNVTVNIHLADDAPGPQVHDLTGTGGPLAAIELRPYPAGVNIIVSSPAQVDRLIAAANAAKELLTRGAS